MLFIYGVFLLSLFKSTATHTINITEENGLEQFLCKDNNPIEQDTRVVLSTSVTHYISSNSSFCTLDTTYSLTLTSDSSRQARIICHGQAHWPTTGFVFTNILNLVLQRIRFTSCGGFLIHSKVINVVNSTSSPLYFTQYQSAVLLFLHINTLFIQDVAIASYYGFAILAINPMDATLNGLVIRASCSKSFFVAHGSSLGSGLLLFFTDHIKMIESVVHNVTINHTTIQNNQENISTINCIADLKYINKVNHFPVINAAGFTVLYTQKNFEPNVYIQKSIFSANAGTASGAILVFHYKSNNGRTILNETLFRGLNQMINCGTIGGSISLIMMNVKNCSNPLIIEKSNFSDYGTIQGYTAGAIYIGIINPSMHAYVNITIKGSIFKHHKIETTGSCLYAKTYSIGTVIPYKVLNVYLKNIIAFQNIQFRLFRAYSRVGLFTVVNGNILSLSGNNIFHDNFGSVFDITNTAVKLNGHMLFLNNKGERAPAFSLNGYSHFHLADGLNASFINNAALSEGGAIYAYDDTSNQCMFQTDTNKFDNIVMTFINNTAAYSGSSIYSNNLYECDLSSGQHRNANNSVALYNRIFKFSSVSHLNNISTPPNFIILCNNTPSSIRTYVRRPGQKISLQVAAVKKYSSAYQYTVVTLSIGSLQMTDSVLSWQVLSSDVNQVLLEKQACTSIQATLIKTHNIPNPVTAALFVSSNFVYTLSYVFLQLIDCPIGFELDLTIGSCICSKLMHKLGRDDPSYQPDCQVSSVSDESISTITRVNSEWIGMIKVSNNSVIAAAISCFLYCAYENRYHHLVVNDTHVALAESGNLLGSIPLCLYNREGVICSQCPRGYSVVFHSNDCKQCSNWWLFTVIMYAVLGLVFIYLLYALKLTLTTGTLNGIIFFTQILEVIDLPSVRYKSVSLLAKSYNYMTIQYPLCFFNGMTELWKQILTAAYSTYLLVIILGIIVFSRFSVRLSNKIVNSSIQVLVTVVHISFSGLLTSIMHVFTSVHIYTNDTESPRLVWYKDGTVEYGKGSHLVLMIITLLTVGIPLILYMTVLLAGRPLMRISYRLREYLRPIYEAIHAPYKHNKEIFFAARLLIVVLLYVIYGCFRGSDMLLGIAIASPVLSVYVAVEAMARPFKSMPLNIFNLYLLSVSTLSYGLTWYFMKSNDEFGAAIILASASSTIIISLIGVIVLHFLWVTGLLAKIKARGQRLWFYLFKQENQRPRFDLSGSFFEPCDRFREPLLSSQHVQYS